MSFMMNLIHQIYRTLDSLLFIGLGGMIMLSCRLKSMKPSRKLEGHVNGFIHGRLDEFKESKNIDWNKTHLDRKPIGISSGVGDLHRQAVLWRHASKCMASDCEVYGLLWKERVSRVDVDPFRTYSDNGMQCHTEYVLRAVHLNKAFKDDVSKALVIIQDGIYAHNLYWKRSNETFKVSISPQIRLVFEEHDGHVYL